MRKSYVLLAGMALVAATSVIAMEHDVSTAPSKADIATVNQLIGGPAVLRRERTSFEDEVAFVALVQRRILQAAPVNTGLPPGRPREIADLVRARKGLCYDRSRAIETALRVAGMEARHVAVYNTTKKGPVMTLLGQTRYSHALSEVKTSRGWMAVDSNRNWIGLSAEGEPLSMADLRAGKRPANGPPIEPIFGVPFTWVYGLYSRHGGFYPPFNRVPDVNWAELADNI